jgi:hypothetical protein
MKYFVNIFPVICLGFVWIRFQFLSEILWPTLTLKKNLNCATPPSEASTHAVLVMSCIFQMKNKFSSNSSLKKHILKFKRWELHQIEVSNDTFESHFRFYLTKNFFFKIRKKAKEIFDRNRLSNIPIDLRREKLHFFKPKVATSKEISWKWTFLN